MTERTEKTMSELDKVKRVLLLCAHADDCEYFAGGLVAKLAAQGAEITEVIATDNGRGSFELDSTELVTRSRDVEAREAARILGKKEVVFLGYPDGYLDETPKNELRRIFMQWVRRVRPDLVLSFDAFASFETHPDHRHVAVAATEAVGFSRMPLFHPEQRSEEGLEPYAVPLCYWFAKHDGLADTVVDIGPWLDKKIEALRAHKSQMRMMVRDFRESLLATGARPDLLPLMAEDNADTVIEFFIRAWNGRIGARVGCELGEAYRRDSAGGMFESM